MNSSDETKLVDAAIMLAKSEMGDVPKSRTSSTGRRTYKYADLADYMSVVAGPMADAGLFAISKTSDLVPSERVTKAGDPQNGCYLTLTMRVIHAESGQWREITCVGEGQDSGDKGAYMATTGSRRYATAIFWDLVTADDPEAGSDVGNAPAASGTSGAAPATTNQQPPISGQDDGIPF